MCIRDRRKISHEHHSFRIVAIDMEYWRLHHFCNLGAVRRRSGIEGVAGCESNLVIHDQVNRAAGLEAPGVGHVECLHDHSLSREGGISMNENWKNLLPF